MSRPVVWFEVLGQDADKLRGFYSQLFDWKFVPTPGTEYAMVNKEPDGIPGGVGKAQQGPGWSTFYVQVDDIDQSVKEAVDAGGKVLAPPYATPDNMRLAVVADPEGHPVGLVQMV